MRPSKRDYFLTIALECSKQSTCNRRQYGSVIVKNNKIVATGYNGAPSGFPHCIGKDCLRKRLNIASRSNYEICRSVHAEQNALLQAGKEAEGALMYINGKENDKHTDCCPCYICLKMLVNSGIKWVCSNSFGVIDWYKPAIELKKYEEKMEEEYAKSKKG